MEDAYFATEKSLNNYHAKEKILKKLKTILLGKSLINLQSYPKNTPLKSWKNYQKKCN